MFAVIQRKKMYEEEKEKLWNFNSYEEMKTTTSRRDLTLSNV